jgi:hypothetical protein
MQVDPLKDVSAELQIQHREMPSEMFFFLDSVSNKSNSSVF